MSSQCCQNLNLVCADPNVDQNTDDNTGLTPREFNGLGSVGHSFH